jgi:hypothetical protein
MHIGGKEATEVVLEANQRRPIVLQASADASALRLTSAMRHYE